MTTAPIPLQNEDSITRARTGLATLIAAFHPALEAISTGKPFELPDSGEHPFLENLVSIFDLSDTDRQILLLAAGAELDPTLAQQLGDLRGVGGIGRADVTTALALLPVGGWEALSTGSPLRRWHLIDIVGSGPYLRREIVLDERILQTLMGINTMDARLEGLVFVVKSGSRLTQRLITISEKIQDAWQEPNIRKWPMLLIAGQDASAKRAIMQHVAINLGLRLFRIEAASIPTSWSEQHAISIFLDRELLLSGGVLLIESEDDSTLSVARQLVERMSGPLALSAEDPDLPINNKQCLRLDLAPPSRDENKAHWNSSLREHAKLIGTGVEQLSEQFSLDQASMDVVAQIAINGTKVAPEKIFDRIWMAAREQSRRRLGGLAERIETTSNWENLVLPNDQIKQLKELAAQVGQAWKVYQSWGWEKKSNRGLGAAALFSGPSGTGKTLAAEVLATELKLDLYRIDLSQVVSKYIGETEKNLSTIFKAAEQSGAILLFDEADALFGKRSEVKDSHDRYANVEVSYLLQQMETYRGLTILTTNQKSALDQAFLRRLRFSISFPFPNVAARKAIWGQIFPKNTPKETMDLKQLSRMNITGGSIRSIALNASFLAANDDLPVGRTHVLRAAQREYAKLEKPFSGSELWEFR